VPVKWWKLVDQFPWVHHGVDAAEAVDGMSAVHRLLENDKAVFHKRPHRFPSRNRCQDLLCRRGKAGAEGCVIDSTLK
jgi:hypothetical protein